MTQQHDLEIFPVRRSPPGGEQIHQERDQVPKEQPNHDPSPIAAMPQPTGRHCRRKSIGGGEP